VVEHEFALKPIAALHPILEVLGVAEPEKEVEEEPEARPRSDSDAHSHGSYGGISDEEY